MDNSITQNAESQSKISPNQAVQALMDGNARFLNKDGLNRDHSEQIAGTSSGQWPFAAVLSCIDSRVPVETVFDQGIGDIFSARVAGNFVNNDILGSLEYACKVAGSKAIMVLGHSGCGAVKGACDNVELGHITGMLSNIMPAIDAITDETENRSSSNAGFVQKVVEENVRVATSDITSKSEILSEMVLKGEIVVVGAVYDVATGKVDLLS